MKGNDYNITCLAQNAPGGRSWEWDTQKLFTWKSIKAG